MTKDFSNQRRDDMRPSSRNASSGRYREEQSFKPARPRLSRDAVDRAWENGASRNHADYRPRQNAQTPPAQRQGRPSPAFNRSQPPQNRRPYEPRQEPYRAPSSEFHSGYQQRHKQSPEAGPRRFNQGGQRAPGGRPGFGSERWTRGSDPQQGGYTERYQDDRSPRFRQERPTTPRRPDYQNDRGPRAFDRPDRQERGPRSFDRPDRQERGSRSFDRPDRQERGSRSFDRPDRQERAPRSFDHPGRQERGPRSFDNSDRQERGPRSFDRPGRPERGPRPFERGDRERESFARGRRTGGPQARRDSSNPRWQSRPAAQPHYQAQSEYPPARREYPVFRQERSDEQPGAAQFEGDYEHFDTYQQAKQVEQPEADYEKHVTRLPGGRVLKGSRPAQRKQARFWTGVEEETTSLMQQIPETQEIQEPVELPTIQEEPAAKTPRPRKRPESAARKVKTVKTARAEDTAPRAEKGKVGKKKAHGPQGPVTRPSQRGYKWPTAGGE